MMRAGVRARTLVNVVSVRARGKSHSSHDADLLRKLSSASWHHHHSHKRSQTLQKLLSPKAARGSVRWWEVENLLTDGLGAKLTFETADKPKNAAKSKCHAAVAYQGATLKRLYRELDELDELNDALSPRLSLDRELAELEEQPELLEACYRAEEEAEEVPPSPSSGKHHHGRPPTDPATKVHLKVQLNGESPSFSRPQLAGATLSMDEMVAVRWLLQRAGVVEGHEGAHTAPQDAAGEDPGAKNPVVMDDKHVLVVLDHQSAQVYSCLAKGAGPTAELTPDDPKGFRRHLRSKRHFNRVGSVFKGDRAPEDAAFYEEVAALLTGATEVVLAGHATGLKSDARRVLQRHLERKHPTVAAAVVGELVVDKHTTKNQLLASARRYFNQLHPE